MVYFKRSQPAPNCLATEKAKGKNSKGKLKGDYKCGDVLKRLKEDFKSKCYLCEQKDPTSINVEHRIPHKGNINLAFDWNNLYWSCTHCNNIKLAKFSNILDCCDDTIDLIEELKYNAVPFPEVFVCITAQTQNPATIETAEFLNATYNGTTELKGYESDSIRNNLRDELNLFTDLIVRYIETKEESIKEAIEHHLTNESAFSAFKIWWMKDNFNYVH